MTNTNIPAARNERQDTRDRNSRRIKRMAGFNDERYFRIQYMDDDDAYRFHIGEREYGAFSFDEMNGLGRWNGPADTQLEVSKTVRIVGVEGDANEFELHFPTGAGQDTPVPLDWQGYVRIMDAWDDIISLGHHICIQRVNDAYRLHIGERVYEEFSFECH